MRDGVGPASYANREDVPEYTIEGIPSIVPMRLMPETTIEARDPDPRGMVVVGADGTVAGTVKDVWVDRAEALIRYLEVDVATPAGTRSVLLPMTMARVSGRSRQVSVKSILAAQFANVPAIAHPIASPSSKRTGSSVITPAARFTPRRNGWDPCYDRLRSDALRTFRSRCRQAKR